MTRSAPSIGRHCMVVHAYYPRGETRVQREAMALVARGYEVDVVCLRDRGESRRGNDDGVRIVRLPARRHRGRGFLLQLLEYIWFFTLAMGTLTARHVRNAYQTVQVHNLPDFLVFAALWPKLTGSAIILDIHDLMPEFFAARTGKSLQSPLVRVVALQERVSCAFADHVITVTALWRGRLIERGVDARKVSVVMNVADPRFFQRSDVPANDEHPVRFELLYHGTFARRYGTDLIVEAMALVSPELPDVYATILGDGDLRREVVSMTREFGLEGRITVSEGMVGVEDVAAAVAKAHVGLVPNREDVFTEGILPTKLLEYVAMGVPVIAARTPGVTDFFSEDQLEFFTPGDAGDLAVRIRHLHASEQRRRELARSADAFNSTYSWEVISSQYASLIASLVPPRHSAPTPDHVVLDDPQSPLRLSTDDAPDNPQWDAFLAGTDHGHHTQTAVWSQVKASLGWRSIRVVAYRDDEIVAGGQLLYRPWGRLGAVGYMSKGPVIADGNRATADAVFDEIERICRSHRIRVLTLQSPGWEAHPPAWLLHRNLIPSSAKLSPRATILVDVTPTSPEMLAAMASKTRYNVRLSERKGVKVREGSLADLTTYYEILRATAKRQGFEPFPLDYFVHMWEVMRPGGLLRLTLAEVEGAVVAGQLAVPFGNSVVNKLSVWSGEYGHARPNEALQWETMSWAHEQGFELYDLEGINLAAAEALIRGESLPKVQSQTVTSFKLGFGGRVVMGPQAQVLVTNPLLRFGFGTLYPRIGDRMWMRRAVKRFRSSASADGR